MTQPLAQMRSIISCLNIYQETHLWWYLIYLMIYGLQVKFLNAEKRPLCIPKPGKDSKNPSNYHPISLTSCLCKTMERMINTRLVWFLEKNNILTKYQSGFRKGRTTTDQLLRLESFIRDSFLKGNHVVSAFFYLEKAYDMVWKYDVIRDLNKVGLRG